MRQQVADAGATLAFTEGDGASVIDSSLTLADVDDDNLDAATVQITTGYQSGEDVWDLRINQALPSVGQYDWNIVVVGLSNKGSI